MYMIITDLFDIDIHIFTVINFLFNLGVRFNYIFNLIPKVINVYEKRRFIFLILYIYDININHRYKILF